MSVETMVQADAGLPNPLGTDVSSSWSSPRRTRLRDLFELMGFTAVARHRSKQACCCKSSLRP